MTNSTTPALPPITDDDLRFLHDNPNTADVVEWVRAYALQATADLTRQLDELKQDVERISAEKVAEFARAREWATRYGAMEHSLAAATRERDEARAEVERLRAQVTIDLAGHPYKAADLLRRAVRHIKPGNAGKGGVFWSNVREKFATGSTVAMALASWAGLDPDTGKPTDDAASKGAQHG